VDEEPPAIIGFYKTVTFLFKPFIEFTSHALIPPISLTIIE